MQVEFKRNLQNNYMVIEAEGDPEENYCLEMAEHNQISGLLTFHSIRTDGRLYIQYEITSRQPLAQMYEKKVLSGNQLSGILTEIYELLENVQEYLLNPSQILFDPQYIYVSAEDRSLQFCYLPGKEQKEMIQVLAEFILKHLDHEDFQAVEMGYLFYQCVQEENFSLKQILKKLLHREKNKGAEYTDTEKRWKEYRINENKSGSRTENKIENRTEHRIEHKERRKEYAFEEEDCGSENSAQNPDMYDVYKVTHKERKKEYTKNWLDQFFQLIHPAVLISTLLLLAVIEILYYFLFINLTEAGGMFFLLISVEMLGNQLWKKRRQKKDEHEFRWISEEEEAMYRILQDEMYDENFVKKEEEMQRRADDGQKRNGEPWTEMLADQDSQETRYLGEKKEIQELRLMPVAGKESGKGVHPEIVMRNEPILIGKRKGESDIILDSPTVSRTHAMLERKGGMYYICDLNSKNGTFCNGERLMPQERRRIMQDDLIVFAELEYRAAIYSSEDTV